MSYDGCGCNPSLDISRVAKVHDALSELQSYRGTPVASRADPHPPASTDAASSFLRVIALDTPVGLKPVETHIRNALRYSGIH
jgi:hypothetical protein